MSAGSMCVWLILPGLSGFVDPKAEAAAVFQPMNIILFICRGHNQEHSKKRKDSGQSIAGLHESYTILAQPAGRTEMNEPAGLFRAGLTSRLLAGAWRGLGACALLGSGSGVLLPHRAGKPDPDTSVWACNVTLLDR